MKEAERRISDVIEQIRYIKDIVIVMFVIVMESDEGKFCIITLQKM